MQERDRCSLEKPGESQGQRSLKLSLEAWRPRGAPAGAGGLGWGGWEQQRIFTENLPCSCPGLYSNHTLAPCPEEEAVIQMISSEQKWQQAGNIQEMALLWDIPWKCIFTKDRLPWWLSNKEPTRNAGVTGDAVSIPGSGRSPGGGYGNPPWYSCLENPTDRGAWRAAVHGVAKGQTRLKQLSTHTHTHEEEMSDSPSLQEHNTGYSFRISFCYPLPVQPGRWALLRKQGFHACLKH